MTSETDTTVTTESERGKSLAEAKPVSTGLSAVCIGVALLLTGNAFLERGIELLRCADRG